MGVSYVGNELDAMAQAHHCQSWILARCRPYLGRCVLELGAGLGTYSSLLLRESAVERLVAIEPAGNRLPDRRERLAAWGA